MNRRRITLNSIAFILCVFLLIPVFASIVYAAPKKVIRVGWFTQIGYQEVDENSKPFGYNYEYLMRIAQHTGWEYEFVISNSFASSYEMLKNGEIDILGFILRTEQREQQVLYPSFSCGNVSTSLFVKKNSPIAEYDFEAFNGLTVACIEAQNPLYLLEYAAEKGFSVSLEYYENMQAAMDAVDSGETDAGVNSSHQTGNTTRIVASFAPMPFYFAMSKNSSKELVEMNNALSSISLDTPFYDRDLSFKYLPQVKSNLTLTNEEQQFIDENPQLEISYYPNWFPVSVQHLQTGEFSGISHDIFERISEITGIKFTYTPVIRGTQEALDAKIIASIVHDYSDAYKSDFRMTNVYLNIPLVLAQRSNFEGEPKTTAVSSHMLDTVDLTSISNTQLVVCDTIQQSLDTLLDGDADQAYLNTFACEYLLRQARYRKLQSSMLYNQSYNICTGIKNEIDPALCSIFNKAFDLISAADINAIIYKNTSRSLEINLSNIVSQMPVDVIMLGVFALIIIIALMAFIIARQRNYSRRMRAILYTDELTGTLSFKGFKSQAVANIAKVHDKKAFIIDFDINHFGEYNSINGYAKGNQLLQNAANISLESCYNEYELCARIQADHFVVLAFDDETKSLLDKIAKGLVSFRNISGSNSLLISYGVYEIVDKKMSIVDMCDCALAAKHTIKGNYEHYVAIYDQQLHRRQIYDVETLEGFDNALNNGEFVHYYQPKYDSITRKIVGAEALVRWIRTEGKIVMPNRFIELFEINGLITRLDLHMFETLCGKMASLMENGINPLPVSINFSRVHLYDNEFAQKLKNIIKRYNVPASLLEIEITETAFVDHQQEIIHMVDLLHEAGFLVSIDDFGSGFSSLNLLKDVNFDIIKLDRIFLSTIGQNKKGETVISSIVSLAGKLQLKTIAEGVETLQQYEMLKNCGCDMVQGYYFSKPMPEEEYLKLYSGA